MTAEELLVYSGAEYCELVRGELVIYEPPSFRHGAAVMAIAAPLAAYVKQRALGTVVVESGCVLQRAPDTVRGPDISFVSRARLSPDQIDETYLEGAPDLVIEVLSPSNTRRQIREKVADYLAAGARLIWVVDPRAKHVVVYRADVPAEVVPWNEPLDGGEVIPGFTITIADLISG
ncbi:MAG: Uma2 family endonuclease [Gemmatimonadaceae bacterium]|nr:Uma2 family endonuclease [Gemmatimonadaceae bacterium]